MKPKLTSSKNIHFIIMSSSRWFGRGVWVHRSVPADWWTSCLGKLLSSIYHKLSSLLGFEWTLAVGGHTTNDSSHSLWLNSVREKQGLLCKLILRPKKIHRRYVIEMRTTCTSAHSKFQVSLRFSSSTLDCFGFYLQKLSQIIKRSTRRPSLKSNPLLGVICANLQRHFLL